jgi:hypothetical protein
VLKKNFEAAAILKIEYLIELIDVGISIPCLSAASTSSFDRPLPDTSFN